jgi:broad specificity phosphatase PhoE
MQTAALLGEAVGLRPEPLEGLRERSFGWMEGRPLRWVDPDGDGPALQRWLVQGLMAFTAEPAAAMAARTVAAAEGLGRAHPDGRVLAVTHWGVISLLVAVLVDGDARLWRGRGPWAACGLTELEHARGAWTALCLNDDAHLKEGSLA